MVVPLSGRPVTGACPVLFGKLPTHGDFVARNLQPAARAAWDDWASGGLDLARQVLGDRFEAAHDSAPPWRFVAGPGPFGPGWRAGALCASVDSAGRRFMVLLAADKLSPAEAAACGETLAAAMEELLYLGFERSLDADALVAEVCPVLERATWADDGRAPVERWWSAGGAEADPHCGPTNWADLLLQMTKPNAEENPA